MCCLFVKRNCIGPIHDLIVAVALNVLFANIFTDINEIRIVLRRCQGSFVLYVNAVDYDGTLYIHTQTPF